ncbi:hypothetical protein [Oscillatoria acuminata]|uniref:hypothetical protein n=1 Tax=Oscillatoria acuminata TaxID=118323 RepID=UPI00031A4027|nr:hypothetical protein [Oscillatoria acuminata]
MLEQNGLDIILSFPAKFVNRPGEGLANPFPESINSQSRLQLLIFQLAFKGWLPGDILFF